MLSLMKPYTGFTTQGSPAKPVSTATCRTNIMQNQQHAAEVL
jgi:hypothetical protein